jgi:signal transduction histidine kinase
VDLAQIQDLVGQLLERVKDMSLNLRPPMLDDLGLVPTLLWHFERYRAQTGIEVQFHHRAAGVALESAVEIAAFRIIQEALTNVARHAGVSEVAVELWVEGNLLALSVEDGGGGFAESSPGGSSSGLTGMRERASLAGGFLSIESRPGAGTLVWSGLPLNGRKLESPR